MIQFSNLYFLNILILKVEKEQKKTEMTYIVGYVSISCLSFACA